MTLEEYNKTKLLIMLVQTDEEIINIEQAKQKFQKIKNENTEEVEKKKF